MNLFPVLFRSRRMLAFTVLAAAVSGACNAGLIALINEALNWADEELPRIVAIAFAALVVGRLVSTLVSAIVLARYSQENIAALRRGLIQKILMVPLRQFETIGVGRVMAVLTEDVLNIAHALLAVPSFAVNLAILACGGVYLAYLSTNVLLVMAGFILVAGLVYRVLIISGFRYLSLAREEEDKLFGSFRALTEGIKELKLHRSRRREFLGSNVRTVTDAYQKHNVSAEVRFAVAQAWNHLLVLGLLGFILFLLPTWQQISVHALSGYVVTTLYLMGPLAGVMGSLSVFGRASASYAKVQQLGISLSAQSAEPYSVTQTPAPTSFERLELVGVTHSYHVEKDDSNFMLGPIDLSFQPGEAVFLVGGNGSGKTSLAKIVTGLYPPEAGDIRIDGRVVTDETRDDYRQLFSVVFSDFHLFDNLLGLAPNLDAQAQEYLRQLHLEHKVKIKDGVLSTTSLSQGQRKRLALLTAYLEDRPFYVFDEWAADQDPLFKEIFYSQIIPDLKARGKAVLVISHDEQYFDHADRILKLDYGKLGTYQRREARIPDAILQS